LGKDTALRGKGARKEVGEGGEEDEVERGMRRHLKGL